MLPECNVNFCTPVGDASLKFLLACRCRVLQLLAEMGAARREASVYAPIDTASDGFGQLVDDEEQPGLDAAVAVETPRG